MYTCSTIIKESILPVRCTVPAAPSSRMVSFSQMYLLHHHEGKYLACQMYCIPAAPSWRKVSCLSSIRTVASSSRADTMYRPRSHTRLHSQNSPKWHQFKSYLCLYWYFTLIRFDWQIIEGICVTVCKKYPLISLNTWAHNGQVKFAKLYNWTECST
jgi:hypothetical protein